MLEFLMLGPKKIDGSGRVQIHNTRLFVMVPNPNNRISLSGMRVDVLNIDRSSFKSNLHKVDIKVLNLDHSALKDNIYSMSLKVLNTTEI